MSDSDSSGPAVDAGRRLDYSPLERGASPRARLRAVAAHPLLLVGMTIGVLLILVPASVLLVMLLADGPVDGGSVAFLVMLLAAGAYVVFDVLRQAGTGVGLSAMARENDLDVTRSLAARHYAGRRFRSGERIVLHSLRTRRPPVVEVGDSWPVTRIRMRTNPTTGAMTARDAPTPEAFLRTVLSGPARSDLRSDRRDDPRVPGRDRHGAPDLVTPELDGLLRGFLGDYTLDVRGRDLTVMGSRPLEPTRPERVAEAFTLIDALGARADALMVDPAEIRPGVTPSPTAAPDRDRRTRHPLVVVGAVLAMLVLVPLGFAVVMSGVDDHLRGEESVARLVVGLLVAVMMGIVAALMRWITSRRRSRGAGPSAAARRPRRRLLLAGGVVLLLAVLLLVLGGVVRGALGPGGSGSDPYAELTSAEECAVGDDRCQWEVSQRVWSAERGLTRPYPLVEGSCEETAPGRSQCHLYLECEAGEAALMAAYEGDPWTVVGVRSLNAGEDVPLSTTDGEVARIVEESCRV